MTIIGVANAQPTNDLCANAIDVGDGAFVGSNVGAEDDGGATCGSSGASVWWRFTAPLTGSTTIETCGSSFDSIVSVFDECGGSEVAGGCDNDTSDCGEFAAKLLIDIVQGEDYFIRVAGIKPGATALTGTIVLTISSVASGDTRPTNDLCGNSGDISIGTTTGTTVSATTDDTASCALSGADVWYHFVAASSGEVTMDTCGSAFDTVLSVFDGCIGGNELACDNDSAACGAGASQLTLNATASTNYFIRVAGEDGATGAFTLTITQGNGNTNGNDNGNTNGNTNTNDNTGGNTNDNTGGNTNTNNNTGGNTNGNTSGNTNGNTNNNDNSAGNDNTDGNGDGTTDANGDGIPDGQQCGSLCPASGGAALAFTLMGMVAMKAGARRGVQRRK